MCGPSWLVIISDLAQGLVPRIPIPWRTQSKGFPPFSLWEVQRHVVVSRGLSRVNIHSLPVSRVWMATEVLSGSVGAHDDPKTPEHCVDS